MAPVPGLDASARAPQPVELPRPSPPSSPPSAPPPSGQPGLTRTAAVLKQVNRRRHRTRWVMAVLAVLALAGAAVWRTAEAPAVVRYTTAPVVVGSVVKTVTASGSVNPVDTVQVGTYVSGVIQSLYCDYNTVVKKGQLCAKIDPRPYQMAVDQARANLAAAKAQLVKDQTNLTYAKLTYNRNIDLQTRGIVPQDTVDSSKSTYDQAVAQVSLDQTQIDQRAAALNAAEINLGYTDIVSPVNGTVIVRNVTQGQTVAASFQTPTLFVIAADLKKMQVDANVSESDIGNVRVGAKASFTVEAFPNHTFEGEVTAVRQAPQTVQNVVTYDAVISVLNPDFLLKPGMTATCRIVAASRDGVVVVPDQALRYTPGGLTGRPASEGTARTTRGAAAGQAHVWVLRDGQPVRVAVTTGLDDDTHTEIVSGLKAGDAVIVGEQSTAGSSRPAGLRMFRL
ncbi:MAG: efflux RND transporter periplasmic adaptor subunit [Acidobacteriota bacterium]|nr:efflux RND transporter periplasmic adaptor subunit [Acidobacteriota bacterium]